MKKKANITPSAILGYIVVGSLLLWLGSMFIFSMWVSAVIALIGVIVLFSALSYVGLYVTRVLRRKL
ncbi:hypothetical protein [Mucilaginibacter auburnensis]|uniref:Uncharacterized protein n=1 Tax=Mucilaginibacter auburnensis TaxID=1457233 RepID=A0A2H9VT93_9SPHI|nr:hypothetical protein [Mucilaginibacter auburnensis]PJJ84030.1 hypothetical protein CLV57_1028 [Mucilaginibacter auburnensis]